VTYLNLSHNDFGQEAAIALGRAIGNVKQTAPPPV